MSCLTQISARMRSGVLALLFGLMTLGGFVSFLSAQSGFNISLSEAQLGNAEQRFGAEARQRLENWIALMRDNQKLSDAEKLRLVNRFFNRIPWVSDLDHWGAEDYWSTPTEMLTTFGGDCEDYSIAKYFTLIALGMPMEKLRITYVRARGWGATNEAHMVLTYYERPDAEPLVLDNLIPEIRPASQRTDLTPVYSFNGDGLWLARERGSTQRAGNSDRLTLWTGLTARMGRELQ